MVLRQREGTHPAHETHCGRVSRQHSFTISIELGIFDAPPCLSHTTGGNTDCTYINTHQHAASHVEPVLPDVNAHENRTRSRVFFMSSGTRARRKTMSQTRIEGPTRRETAASWSRGDRTGACTMRPAPRSTQEERVSWPLFARSCQQALGVRSRVQQCLCV